MDLLETNQSARLALAESAVQVIPTSPEILDGGIPKGWRRGGTAGEVGDWPLLPMIVRFHRSTMTILWKWNLQHRRCPSLHSLPLIEDLSGKGGAMLVSARGTWTALAAARVAKIRAVTTLNCILPFCETEDCQLEEVGKPNDLYTSRLGGSTTCVNKSWIAKLESMVGQGMPHPGEAGSVQTLALSSPWKHHSPL